MPDINHYPLETELRTIREWDTAKDPIGLIDYLEGVWEYADMAIKRKGRRVVYLELHTYGWSGNEDIIEALYKNLFFMFYWCKSLRGGHYYFKVRRFPKAKSTTPQRIKGG